MGVGVAVLGLVVGICDGAEVGSAVGMDGAEVGGVVGSGVGFSVGDALTKFGTAQNRTGQWTN